MINEFLTEKPAVLFDKFLDDYQMLFDIDRNEAKRIMKDGSLFKKLTEKWYDRLEQNNLTEAFEVYDDEYYFVDIFNCFSTYSRNYIKRLLKPSMADDKSIYDLLKNSQSFVDIGCGISYSTCALKTLLPNTKAYGINLKNTKQWKLCEVMAKRHDFNLIESVHHINHNVDFVFASEYFEHIYNPTAHVREIMDVISPKYFIIANAFNTWSIGHFTEYEHAGNIVDQSKMSKIFNQFMINNGYKKVDCKMWNNKPVIWSRGV
jgi:2-polyprenyl-3-methyl-5-hydroxy-6-metoxy-1,4-benzoquinol methylase